MKLQVYFGSLLVGIAFWTAGCSQVPHSVNYQYLSPGTDRAERWARSDQDERNEGKFAGADQVLKNIKIRTMYSDCYRLTEAHAQYGLLEPEAVFRGEAVHSKGLEAVVVVAPILRDYKEFPTPIKLEGAELYRLDKQAGFAESALRMMESIVGNPKYCARFGAIDSKKSKGKHRNLIAVSVMPVGKASAPRKHPVPRKKKEKNTDKSTVKG